MCASGARPTTAELLSGDLGYVAGGHLFVVDRLKDLVIACGRNYVPSDLERVACSVSGVKPGNVAVFGTRDDGTEGVVVVIATDKPARRRAAERGARRAAIARRALAAGCVRRGEGGDPRDVQREDPARGVQEGVRGGDAAEGVRAPTTDRGQGVHRMTECTHAPRGLPRVRSSRAVRRRALPVLRARLPAASSAGAGGAQRGRCDRGRRRCSGRWRGSVLWRRLLAGLRRPVS
jgi:acyl-CoA synthetase (AMP-forming)/AMP-acid ligase II